MGPVVIGEKAEEGVMGVAMAMAAGVAVGTMAVAVILVVVAAWSLAPPTRECPRCPDPQE